MPGLDDKAQSLAKDIKDEAKRKAKQGLRTIGDKLEHLGEGK
jgi:hypothetical protein